MNYTIASGATIKLRLIGDQGWARRPRMRQIRHMCVDIRGMLRNTRFPAGYHGVMHHDDGRSMKPEEARESLYDALAKGWKVLPTGPCEGFSYQTGCPGHEVPEEAEDGL
jgi:hypothetical protein